VDRSSAEGTLVEAPKRSGGVGRGLREIDPSPENVLLFDLKMEHFGAVFI